MTASKYKTLEIREGFLDALLSDIKSDIVTSTDALTFNHGKLSVLLLLSLISLDVYNQIFDSAMNSVFFPDTLKLTTGEAP